MDRHTDMIERRRFGRRSCRVHGWVRLNRRTRIPCVMTDYSQSGARLHLAVPTILPLRIWICFDGFDRAIPCEIRHVHDVEVGVEFRQPSQRRSRDANVASELLNWLAPTFVGNGSKSNRHEEQA